MKNIIRVATLVLALICMAGCDDAEEISAAEFQAKLERNPETMRHSEFIGVKDGKAYLKVSTMSILNRKKWKETYFVTDANQLPLEWLNKQRHSVKADTIDTDITIELTVRLEVNGRVEDSRKAQFTMRKGSPVPDELSLTSAQGATLRFQAFRLQDGSAVFDGWGFDGFTPFVSKRGTTLSAWPYESEVKGGFRIPIDGTGKIDKWLTFYETASGGEFIKLCASLDIREEK